MSAQFPAKPCQLGVIGGSGIYKMEGAKILKEHNLDTPFGKPSSPIFETEINGAKVFFLARHGTSHSILPTEVPYRANIHALKQVGVTHLLAISAVGIMKEHIKPGDSVVPDQIFDRTKGIRDATFFGEGVVGHVQFSDPFCNEMRDIILKACQKAGATVHDGGSYVCMEGPQFSTRCESEFYRATIKPSVIGMTAIPEAKLARETEMSYGMLALATDYDCWHEEEEEVSVEAVLEVLRSNAAMANKILQTLAPMVPKESDNPNLYAAKFAIVTNPEIIPDKTKQNLAALYGHYWGI